MGETQRGKEKLVPALLHPTELEFLEYVRKLGFGKIDSLEVQNGLPLMAKVVHEHIKFGSKQ